MRVVVICDSDERVGHLDERDVDLVLSLGDLWDASIEKAYACYFPKQIFAVRGNHDSSGPFPKYVTPLHYTVESFGGLTFGGFNGCWRYKPKGNHLFSQEEVSMMMRAFPRVDVFVAHNSPRGVHERDQEVHQGFDGFRDYIEGMKPKFFIHGHQHCDKETKIGETRVIGIYGERFLSLG